MRPGAPARAGRYPAVRRRPIARRYEWACAARLASFALPQCAGFPCAADPAARGRNRGVDRSGRVRSRSLPPWTKPKLARIGADASLRVYTAVMLFPRLQRRIRERKRLRRLRRAHRAPAAPLASRSHAPRSLRAPVEPTESSACSSRSEPATRKRTTTASGGRDGSRSRRRSGYRVWTTGASENSTPVALPQRPGITSVPILPLRRSALSRQPDEMKKGEIAKAHVVLTPSAEPNADGILTLCRGRADANNSSSALASDNRREVRSSPRSPAHRTVSGIPTPSLNVRATSAQAREATGGASQWAVAVGVHSRRGRASGRWCRERGRRWSRRGRWRSGRRSSRGVRSGAIRLGRAR